MRSARAGAMSANVITAGRQSLRGVFMRFLLCVRSYRLFVADLVNDVIGYGDFIEIAVGSLLDIRGGPESTSDLQSLALSPLEFRRGELIVSNEVRQPGIGADVYVEPVGRETQAVKASA